MVETLLRSEPGGGLSHDEVLEQRQKWGSNLIPQPALPSTVVRILGQLRDPLVLVLLAAAAVTIATGDRADAAIIAIVVVLNTAVGVAQQRGADKAVGALARMAAPAAQVVRDGVTQVLDATEVVPGDVVVLAEGAVVPADGVLLEAVRLLVDESSLTGESQPVEKEASRSGVDEVSSGTVVLRGRAVMRVTRTGSGSSLGRIAALVAGAPPATPLQRRLAHLGRTLAIVSSVLAAVVFAAGVASGRGVELMAVTAISLVVAAVPESLPIVVTLALASGARRMAARNAIVRHLSAVEALGSVTVLCTDKTGTLTRGDMLAQLAWTPLGLVTLPEGDTSLSDLLRAAALCSDATLPATDDGHATGDPTEVALLRAAASGGLDRAVCEAQQPRVAEVPFDSGRRRMTTVHRAADGGYLVVTKGAPEVLLDGRIIAAAQGVRTEALKQAEAMAARGQRVLAFGWGRRDDLPRELAAVEQGLQLLGLVGVADPVRATAAATVTSFVTAGITPVPISGDNRLTAQAVATQVGIERRGGRQAVFARSNPEAKLRIVRSLQAQGEIVAMIGDGVNDAPALRQADIGIAMGRRGTEAARQAADLVLADDELGTLTGAIEEGRRVYDNVRRFLLFALAGGTAEVAVMLLGPVVGLGVPLLPGQILWVNLLTHGLPGVAMGAEPVEPDALRRPPRPVAQSVLGGGLWQRVAVLAALVTAASLASGVLVGQGDSRWQSVLFTTLAAAQFGIAAGVRSHGPRTGTWFLPVAVAAACLLQAAALYASPLQDLLDTQPLSSAQLGVTVVTGLVSYAVARRLSRPPR